MVSSHLAPAPVIFLMDPFGGSTRRQNANLAHVFYDDAVVTRGDGVFETLLIRNGRPVNIDRHLDRFCQSARALDLVEPVRQQWVKATSEAIAEYCHERGDLHANSTDAKCVWTLTRGRESTGVPTAWLTVRPVDPALAQQRHTGVRAVTTPRGYTISTGEQAVPWLTVGVKSLNYTASMAALRWARSNGFDDVIYIDPANGRVLEGATSTVVIARGDRKLRTPATGPDVLDGTTQQSLFDYAKTQGWRCKQKDLFVEDLFSADSVWLVSSVRLGVRVTELNGRACPEPPNAEEIYQLIEKSLTATL